MTFDQRTLRVCLFVQQTFSESGRLNLNQAEADTNPTLKRSIATGTLNSKAIYKMH